MKKAYGKNVLRTIKSTLSRFLAIFAIVALGVGFLAGLLASPGDMRLSADTYYDDTDMYDLRIVSTLGLTEEDLQKVREIQGVEAVLPVRDTDLLYLSRDEDLFTTRVHTLPRAGEPAMNTPILLTGRMPERRDECVVTVTKSIVEPRDWIGETLTLQEDGDSDSLPRSLTVVGTVKNSVYLSMEQEHTTAGSGTVSLILYTLDEAFSYDYYTGFYLRLAGARDMNSFGKSYEDLTEEVKAILEDLGEDRSALRYEEVLSQAETELADAEKEYADGEAEAREELDKARKELEDGERELEENGKTLEDARQQLEDGEKELDENRALYEEQTAQAQSQIDSGYSQLSQAETQLEAGKKQLADGQAQLDAGFAQLKDSEAQLAQGEAALREAEAALAAQGLGPEEIRLLLAEQRNAYEANLAAFQAAKAQLEETRAALEKNKAELEAQQALLESQRQQLDESASVLRRTKAETEARLQEARDALVTGRQEYEDGLAKLEEGKKDLAEGRQEYEDARQEADEELADARQKLDDARQELDDLEPGEWFVFTRDDNAGFASYKSNADKIAAIASVFPLFFFLVAALVALTTMTRMVEEERQQIGTMKALGYERRSIAGKYLIYASAASVAGSVTGLLCGFQVFPTIIINAYNIMYDIPRAITPFSVPYALFSALAAIFCTLVSTFSACRAELKEAPASLLLPKAPKAGKRVFLEYITPLWNRLKFTQKVTARNLIRYKKRFFMTIIGISGCTALLVTGFGIKDSISHIVSNQYEDLNHYQLTLVTEEQEDGLGQPLSRILEESVEDFLPVSMDSGRMVPAGSDPEDDVTLLVYEDPDRLREFMTFRRRTNHEGVPLTLETGSVLVSEKLAERQHLQVGDMLTVENGDGKAAGFTVSGICENYVGHYVYLSQPAYKEAFGKPFPANTVLCKLKEDITKEAEEQLATRAMECENVLAVRFTDELAESFSNTIGSLNSIVLVLIISAGVLAFVVLYNLININISERVKELATIKVLGFYDSEVSAYVYRETAILTIIGDAVGLVLGVFLHQFVIRTAEIDIVMFGRSVYPLSFVWSALLTVVFSVLVNLVMHRKLKNISMVESMKAPE